VRAALPEEAGGPGLEFEDAMAALRRTAYQAVPLPLAETMLAGRLLVAAGLDVPDGPLTVAHVGVGERLHVRGPASGRSVTGEAARVPWGRHCPHIVVVARGDDDGDEWVGIVRDFQLGERPERNLAGEPRDTCVFRDAPLLAAARLADAAERLELEGALYRSVQMTGALERILGHALRYANDRVQFGRPIAKFQAIQHMLAVMAGHVAASSAVTDAAVESAATRPVFFAVAAAKARVGEAAGKCAEIAHQVHGAMGYTHEHALHYNTRRLWSWREEFGNEAVWQVRLGRAVAEKGASSLWADLTELQKAVG
jgi:acyl-CoA dehydrogenase